MCVCAHRSDGALEGGEASQDLVCDHHRHGTARGAHGLLRGSPREGKSITEPAGVSSKQRENERRKTDTNTHTETNGRDICRR